ncbi:YtxH domain-containing protein [Aquimarina sp. U1-2]|uniref:YtxH domain-containing protein n=1 Tax=Aquimarina sp. U1-2 TaxID=2823141 RepID=UPI001AECAF31|nr:YtxH domain-containing protein [Aquimarina sp. U1-2]MBP2830710.1 YtxH domain-containing protein [Aquimarina sp. U1-2]
MSDSSNTFLGILAGTAVGATLGILFAPDKGINTRRRLAEEAQATKDNLAREASHLQHKIVDTVSSQKQTLDTKIESLVSDASYKADDVITSLEKKLRELKAKNKKLQKS